MVSNDYILRRGSKLEDGEVSLVTIPQIQAESPTSSSKDQNANQATDHENKQNLTNAPKKSAVCVML